MSVKIRNSFISRVLLLSVSSFLNSSWVSIALEATCAWCFYCDMCLAPKVSKHL